MEDTPLRDVVAALFSDLLPPRTRVGWADLRRHFLILLLLGPVVAAEPAAEPHFQLHRAVGLRSSLAAATGRYSGSERRLIEVAVHAFSNAVILLFAGGAVVALDADSHAEVFSAQLELGGGCLLVRPGDRRKDNQDDEGDGENSRRQQQRRSSSSSSSSRGTRREGGLSAGVRGALDVMACAAGAPFFAVNLSSTVAEGGGGGASRDTRRRRRHRHHHHHLHHHRRHHHHQRQHQPQHPHQHQHTTPALGRGSAASLLKHMVEVAFAGASGSHEFCVVPVVHGEGGGRGGSGRKGITKRCGGVLELLEYCQYTRVLEHRSLSSMAL